MNRRIIGSLLTATLCTVTQAQGVVRAEYFLDTDPGFGAATSVEGAELGAKDYVLSLDGIKAGAHILYVRGQDAEGRWSPTVSQPLYVEPYRGFWQLEYFYDDADPGVGKATQLSRPTRSIGELLYSLPTTGLAVGTHTLNVRGMQQDGTWSGTVSRTFAILEHIIPVEKGNLEYFLDTDPGYGQGWTVAATTGTNRLSLDLGGVSNGTHILYIRCKDEQNRWSPTVSRPLYVCRYPNVMAVEYFFDQADPGLGQGTHVPLPEGKPTEMAFEVAVGGLPLGQHYLNVRMMDSFGRWTDISSEPFTLIADPTGVLQVVTDFAFTIDAKLSRCHITPCANNNRHDCHVSIYTLGGQCMAERLWHPTEKQLSLPVNIQSNSVLIVKIQDIEDGRQMTKHIIIK